MMGAQTWKKEYKKKYKLLIIQITDHSTYNAHIEIISISRNLLKRMAKLVRTELFNTLFFIRMYQAIHKFGSKFYKQIDKIQVV